jgi:hypothetical protein
MTDFISMAVWLLLSSLVRQVETGLDADEQDENDTGSGDAGGQDLGVGVDSEPYLPIEQAIKIGIVALSVLLLGLSLSAYRKTALKRIIYAAVAFGLFAVQMFFDYLQDAIPSFEQPYNDVIFLGITLVILVLFFTAIVRRK